MTKIDIISGFLGAGKTTLIKKLIKEAYAGEKIVLIENEFGEIGIDGGFMQDAGITVNEMNSGCICCSLVGDFSKALKQVCAQYAPERIVIEPSGVGKLSDVVKAVAAADLHDAALNATCTVVDASKCKMYIKNFGEFFLDQVETADCIVLSHADKTPAEKLAAAVALLQEKNPNATLVSAPLTELCGKDILATMERKNSLSADMAALEKEMERHHEHHHHHDHECHDEDCCCHDHEHHHDHECHDEDCCCHDHEHHHHHDHHDHECHDENCCCHDHEHHHHHDHHDHECHDENCCCHDHEHHHHHGHHHADEVFTSWGVETPKTFTKAALECMLEKLQDETKYGVILRAKGIVAGEDGWLHFDYVPGEADVRVGSAGVIGRLCVIGCQLKEDELKALFNV